MNKTVFHIVICFSAVAALIATILLCINALGFAILGSDTTTQIHGRSPQGLLEDVTEMFRETENGFMLTGDVSLPDSCWCILLNDAGEIIWSEHQPDDIPTHYSIRDIAKLTRWFLNDYPVYVSAEEVGLFILGIPKNAVGKYDMAYSMQWFGSLPQRIGAIFCINLLLALILALLFGVRLYRKLNRVTVGVRDLREEKIVSLPEKGMLKELTHHLNETSRAIARKNRQLSIRDQARTHWISGISHDIRTPLAIIMGKAERIEESDTTPANRGYAAVILKQSTKIKHLVEDLNLISSLSYDMQPIGKKPIRLAPLIRGVVSDMINQGIAPSFRIELKLEYEQAVILGDRFLLERALYNLLQNAVQHNLGGCEIHIETQKKDSSVCLSVFDNGIGVPQEVLEAIEEIPNTAHGLGLPMACKIIQAHGGRFEAYNQNGFVVRITLPIYE